MTIKLIAIDIDGTLLDNQHQLLPEVSTTLKEKSAAGVKIVLCSGRPILGMLPYVEALGLNTTDEYTISYNGALVQHNGDQKVLIDHGLDYHDFLRFERLSRELGVRMQAVDLTTIYTPNKRISPYTVFDSYATGVPLVYAAPTEFAPETRFNKLTFSEEPELLDQALTQLPPGLEEEYYLVKSMPFYFDILNKHASKGRSLGELASYLGIKPEEVMAIGDNDNDVDMLHYAGVGIAMGNASTNAKAAATHITKTNQEAGVAHAIHTWG